MSKKKILKWLKYIVLIHMILLIISAFLVNRERKRMYGGLTEVVNTNEFTPYEGSFAIKNVTILSAEGNSLLPNRTILIEKGLIATIDSTLNISKVTKVIDGTGKYLIPGLIDSHVHMFQSSNDLLLYLVNGITHVREMIGTEEHLTWREEIKNGRIGPELYIASPRLGSFDFWEGLFMSYTQGYSNVTSATEATDKVAEYIEKGYDGIKIYSQLNKESYLAISETKDIDIIGHIPIHVSLTEVWNGNQREVAHFEEIMNSLFREFGSPHLRENKGAFFNFIDERSNAVAEALLKNDIAVTSVLWGWHTHLRQKEDLKGLLSEVAIEYENPGISEGIKYIPEGGLGWLPQFNRVRYPEGLSEESKNERKIFWTIYAEACERVGKNMHKKGVKILAGTDNNLSVKVPGFSLHQELQSLHKMGMSPSEALRSATATPAKWLNNNAGVIDTGYKANLVLLDKNPLENIENTESIHTVIVGGKIFDRQLLDSMLNAVKKANDNSRTVDINSYKRKK